MHRALTPLLLAVFIASPVWAQDLGLSPLQAVSLSLVTEVLVHPAGDQVAFVRLVPRMGDRAPGGAFTRLFIMPANGGPGDERLLIGGDGTVRGVAFSPDGEWITFVRRGEGDPHAEVYGLPLHGGEARRLTKTPHGVSSYAWRPDGSGIAFTATDPLPEETAQARKMGFLQRVQDEDFRPISLWYWDKATAASRRLTFEGSVISFEWAPDGSKLAIGRAPRSLVDDTYMMVRLWSVDLESGSLTSIVDNPGKLGSYAWSKAGDRLAYISAADRRDPHAGMLYVVEPGGAPIALTPDFQGMVHEVEWMTDHSLTCLVSKGVRTGFMTIDLSTMQLGSLRHDDQGLAYAHYGAHRASGALYVVGSSPEHPDELFRLGGDGAFARMTDSNPWLSSVKLARQTVEKITARDGMVIEGLMMHPLNEEEGGKHPLVIVAHGGPESHFSNGWLTGYSTWGQILAARGYYVWFPNYRASTGYGVAFAKADHGDPMGGEFRDHLDAIETFAKKGWVDRSRVGIGGGSYGGYTAAWAATASTADFAAAVSFVPFVDIRTKWYTSDIPVEFHRVHYEEKWPHEQEDFLRERSPLTYAPRCRTPLLLLGGDRDSRVHPSQPFMLYRAVKVATKTPVRYVIYPDEGHGNRINVNRYDYLLRTLRWFDHYLSGADRRNAELPPYELSYGAWADSVTR